MILTLDLLWNEGASSSDSDVDLYVIIIELLDSIFNILPLFIHTNRRGFFLKVAYAWCDVPWFVEWMAFTQINEKTIIC
jgi:hypothetical protein